MKTIIMTAIPDSKSYELFDKRKSSCELKEKTSCGCNSHSKKETMAKTGGHRPIVITGTITDEATGEPLIGATAHNLNTKLGDSTNLDGQFTISGSGDDIISFSYVGYKEAKIPFSQIGENVSLKSDGMLNEIVITAKKTIEKATKNYAGIIVGACLVSLFTYAKTNEKKATT